MTNGPKRKNYSKNYALIIFILASSSHHVLAQTITRQITYDKNGRVATVIQDTMVRVNTYDDVGNWLSDTLVQAPPPPHIPLPVELISFTAIGQVSAEGKRSVLLSWHTITETDNDRFLVEWSKDGLDWKAIAEVKGAETSVVQQEYSAVHHTPEPVVKNNNYRLKQVDLNGTYTYSDVVVVDFEESNQGNFALFPNPTNQFLTVRHLGQNSIYIASISDKSGRSIAINTIKVSEQEWKISVEDYSSGTYLLSIVLSTSEMVHLQFVVE